MTSNLYNHSTNYTGITELFLDYPNEIIFGDTWGLILVFTFGSISFLASDSTPEKSFALAAFVMFVSGTMLRVLGTLSDYGFALTVVILVGAFAVNNRTKNKRGVKI